MENPLISIVIPIYNTAEYLPRAIESVLNQSYRNLEIILIDDGSQDNSSMICKAYVAKDNRIVFVSKQNGGLSSARNTGIQIAKGSYIFFLDSDDYLNPITIARLYEAICVGGCAVAQCAYYRFEDEPFQSVTPGIIEIKEQGDILKNIHVTSYIIACNKLYDINLFSNIRFPEGMIHEDVGTTYKILYTAKKIAVISDPLYGYYKNPNSITTGKITIKKLDLLSIYTEQILFFQEKDLPDIACSAANMLAATFGALLCYDKICYKDYDNFVVELQNRFAAIRETILKTTSLRWDLRIAVQMSFGNVKFMGFYHKVKCVLRKILKTDTGNEKEKC